MTIGTAQPAPADHDQRVASPAVSVEVAMLTLAEGEVRVLLARRDEAPFAGLWSLPGRFVGPDESLEDAAIRQVRAWLGLDDVALEQLYTFGNPARDPRGRVIAVVYFALIDAARLATPPTGANDNSGWFALHRLPRLALDHRQILETTLVRLRGKLEYTAIGFQLLPAEFTLSDLQRVYEAILGRRLDKRNFRKKILATGILEVTERTKMEGSHRPARLYRFQPGATR